MHSGCELGCNEEKQGSESHHKACKSRRFYLVRTCGLHQYHIAGIAEYGYYGKNDSCCCISAFYGHGITAGKQTGSDDGYRYCCHNDWGFPFFCEEHHAYGHSHGIHEVYHRCRSAGNVGIGHQQRCRSPCPENAQKKYLSELFPCNGKRTAHDQCEQGEGCRCSSPAVGEYFSRRQSCGHQ